MITRPLQLADRLRKPPPSMDTLHYVNVVLLGLFFAIFGSRFVLSPGIEIEKPDFRLPESPSGLQSAISTKSVISVLGPNMVFTEQGRMSFAELSAWLPTQVARGGEGESRLLVRADTRVSAADLMKIYDLADEAGFTGVQLALENVADDQFKSR
ncbi:MAG: hypothetical protein SynsKO_22900 [Synoicihabitans sp.]